MAKDFTFLLLLSCCLIARISAENEPSDLVAAESIASKGYEVQSVAAPESGGKYGYPYMIAPTLTPRIQARADDDDISTSQEKPYGSRVASSGAGLVKKSNKKSKIQQDATRRQDDDDASIERRFMTYSLPKYRKFDELEDDFSPRRMDIDIPYSQYDYSSKLSSKPSVSPRDPYLSPSAEPVDTFYPTVPKTKSYSAYGKQRRPSYGAGSYDDSLRYQRGTGYGGPSSGYSPIGGPTSSYSPSGGPSSSYSSGGHSPSYPLSGGSSPSYPSSGGSSPSYPSSGGPYHYNDYAIKSHEPIMGNIRKKLLDYAGASDLYENEPDYLREVSRNKYKYGNIGNDYYAYGGPGYRDTYRDFPYIESKISLIKKSRRA